MNHEKIGQKLPEEPSDDLWPHLKKERGDDYDNVYRAFKNDPEMLDHLNEQAKRSNRVTEKMKQFIYEKNGIVISYDHTSTGGWDKDNNPDIGVRIERMSAIKKHEKEYKETGEFLPLLCPEDSVVANVGYKSWVKFINNPESIKIKNSESYKTMDEIIELIRALE